MLEVWDFLLPKSSPIDGEEKKSFDVEERKHFVPEAQGPVAYRMKLSVNLRFVCSLPETEWTQFSVDA